VEGSSLSLSLTAHNQLSPHDPRAPPIANSSHPAEHRSTLRSSNSVACNTHSCYIAPFRDSVDDASISAQAPSFFLILRPQLPQHVIFLCRFVLDMTLQIRPASVPAPQRAIHVSTVGVSCLEQATRTPFGVSRLKRATRTL